MIGLRTMYKVAANVVVNASTVLVTTGLTSPIAVNQTQNIRAWIPFTVGATGGFKFQLLVPAGGTLFEASWEVNDPVTPSTVLALQNASAAFANALAVAGSHWVKLDATIVNGATAGNVDLQVACNSAANGITVLASAWMDVGRF